VNEKLGASANNSISFGPFRLLPSRQLLLEADTPVHLGSRALAILIALTERAGELVSKDELITRVWPNTFVEEGNLRVHVAALRRALGDGRGARYVANIPGRGYRFVAPVALEKEVKPTAPRARGAAQARSLSLPLTRMVGRADMVAALARHLPERRFITVVGPGGIGKTTVALAAAHAVSGSYDDGIRFVDLASLGDPALVPTAVASVLGLTIRSDNPVPGLVAFLAEKQMLLVLDSCEHVIEAVAVLAVGLLRGAPGVHILATSREPLRAEGERVQRLAPLGLPPASSGLTAAEAMTFPAVQLFVERAAAILDGFELSDADAPVVAEICCRLDGIALAIELAAGRVDTFGVRGVAARLDDRFRLLTRGRRTALVRHQTLSAALDWSYEVLPEAERLVLRSLAVFAGGFTLDDASAMVPAGVAASDIAEIIANLVAKSLVTADVGGATPEYRLLDTTRAYAVEKLGESGEREQAARRHADYYRRLFERAESERETQPAAQWLTQYGRHLDNLRAALDWAFSAEGDASLGIALTAASVPLWMHLSLMEECRRSIKRALGALARGTTADIRQEMQLLTAWGSAVLLTNGLDPDSTAALNRALEIAESLGDDDYRLRSLWGLFVDRILTGQYRAALTLAEKFRRVAANSGDLAEELIGERMAGTALHILGDQRKARRHVERMLRQYVAPLHRVPIRFPFDQRVVARSTYARILWLEGFADQAMRAVEESVEDARAIDHPVSLFYALVQAACPVSLLAGDLATADRFVTEILNLSARQAMDPWNVWGQAFRGVLLIKRGDPAAGLQLVRTALAGLPESAFFFHYTTYLCESADALGRIGEPAKGLVIIDEALSLSERNDERWCVAELLRVKGELILLRAALKSGKEAEEHFRESLDWAGRQGALAWALRTSTSCARLLRHQRRAREARDLLAPVYERFTEGFATGDLKAAKTLLDELA
jgi:predicted ATPase/DNA-binding winged helix-turn-helix (wHTH) protein